MQLGIDDRVALVTGAGRGIGRAIACALGKEGARLVVVSRSLEDLQAVIGNLPGPNDRHLLIPLDLTEPDAPIRLRDKITESFGAPDIIVHNMGGSLGVTDPLAASAEWLKVWQFNVGIAHELNRLFIPGMISRRWGRVLHLSTLSTQTHDGHAAYVSAKCALEGYVKAMARHVARHNVIVNSLAPGLTDIEGRYFSRMRLENPAVLETFFDHHLPIRRMGRPEELGEIAAFLCSEQAAFMAGSILRADGGGH